ncbi:hypothetical protein CSHOW_0604 [Campylobacter showae]|uniref:TNase-like domain-containing protein n=1 Tax=Campylobacter showae RM3277 TaxID=553219 RepID=C6RG02_9BACT|nr:hypothetical protein [Campylobacter showae]EET79697.1 hypothetical protein CAMSH0001_2265 [Campylobacter showae RM3277]QCD48558.1 hypothetical protein CSHOW_0604 [Campylobacter showae]
MTKSAFFTLIKFCALALLSVNSVAEFTDMQITQTTKSKREKVAKEVLFLEKILDYNTFVFRLNAAVIAPCKLANVKFYDGSKCIKDNKELENFTKSYDKEIKKIFRPERNYYVLTLKNLGDRWLCEVSDESRILNKTLVKNGLALPTSKEYQKIEVKEDWAEKNHAEIYECLTGKKLEEPKKKSKKAENNATKNVQTEQNPTSEQPTQTQPQTPPPPMESQGNGPVNLRELGVEFGKDFGDK